MPWAYRGEGAVGAAAAGATGTSTVTTATTAAATSSLLIPDRIIDPEGAPVALLLSRLRTPSFNALPEKGAIGILCGQLSPKVARMTYGGLGRLVLTGVLPQIADLPRGQRGEGHWRGGQRRLRVVEGVMKVVPAGIPLAKGSQPPIGLDVGEGGGERGRRVVNEMRPGVRTDDRHGNPEPHANFGWRHMVVEAAAIVVGQEDCRGSPLGAVLDRPDD